MTIDDQIREIIRAEVRNAIRDELQPVLSALERLARDSDPQSAEQAASRPRSDVQGRWLKTEEAAAMMGLSRGTLDNWRALKPPKGPEYRRVGRVVRYDRAEVERFIAGDRVQS